ncbi:class I SAM-dependent methyltransferase [Promicromonospora soli]
MTVSCPICRATETSVLFVLPHMRIAQCHTCDLVSGRCLDRDELVSATYDASYFQDRPAYREYMRGEMAERRQIAAALLDIFRRWDEPVQRASARGQGARFLDYGCGAGYVVEAAHERGYRALGFDVSPAVIDLARELSSGGSFVVGDVDSLGVSGAMFHSISFIDTLEHLDDPVRVLTKVSVSLKNGGQLFVTVPRWGGWMSTQQGRDYYHYTNDHKWFYSIDTLGQVLELAGLDVVHIGSLGDELSRAGWRSTPAGDKYVNRRDHLFAVARLAR